MKPSGLCLACGKSHLLDVIVLPTERGWDLPKVTQHVAKAELRQEPWTEGSEEPPLPKGKTSQGLGACAHPAAKQRRA